MLSPLSTERQTENEAHKLDSHSSTHALKSPFFDTSTEEYVELILSMFTWQQNRQKGVLPLPRIAAKCHHKPEQKP